MRPDEMDGNLMSLGSEWPGDSDFAALEVELSAAGTRARRGAPAAPAGRFAGELRGRLLASYGAAVEVAEPSAVPGLFTGGSSSSRARGADGPGLRPLPTGPIDHAPTPLAGHTRLRTPTVLPAPRWSFLAVAVVLIVALAGLNGELLFPAPPESRVASAIGAQLIRAGATTALTAGTELNPGDEVVTAADGYAALQIGDSQIRLAGGADVRLAVLDGSRVAIDQIAGRAWHRVVLADGGRYVVTTDDVTWTALGTAFDLDRSGSGASGGDIVRELSVQHAVIVEGPGLRVTLDEGRSATVRLGTSPSLTTEDVGVATAAADPWIRANVIADDADGLPLGMMAGLDLAVATAGPTPNVTPNRTTQPELTQPPIETAGPTSAPTATPTPTPKPTPRPTAKPTSAPTFGTMAISAAACPGGVVINWSVKDMAAFNHVQVLRATSAEIPTVYPPADGVVAIGGGYTTKAGTTDGYDPTVDGGGSAWYRAVVFDVKNRAIAASVATGVTTLGVVDLGTLRVTGTGPGELTFSWTPFSGSAGCFSYYKVVASQEDQTPSYLEGSQYLAAIGTQIAAGTIVGGLPSGTPYWLRVQAIRVTSLGKFVSAETIPIQYTVP